MISKEMKISAFKQKAESLLKFYRNKTELSLLLKNLLNNQTLFSQSASFAKLDKIVLWESAESEIQLRLHVYKTEIRQLSCKEIDISSIHNHRWNFSSLILSGGYLHKIYEFKTNSLLHIQEQLIPKVIREEKIGHCYTLHHSDFHSIEEMPDTVSLIVKGKAQKSSFQVAVQQNTNVLLKDITPVERHQECYKMTLTQLHTVLMRLQKLDIIKF